MSLKPRSALLAAAVLLVACQPATQPPPVPGASASNGATPSAAPSAGASASGAPSAAPSAAPSVTPSAATPGPTPSVATKRELVLGSIYNELGGKVEAAELTITSADPAFNSKVSGAGGVYSISGVPVGTTLTLTATAPGFNARSRAIKVREVVPFVEDDPNRLDFGGRGSGMYYYLTRQPDISHTVPANLATGVTTNPLKIDFHFPNALAENSRKRFDSLVTVRFPALDDASTEGGSVLRDSSTYRQERADVTWDEDGHRATFAFAAPIVTLRGGAVVVELDPEADLDDYPEDEGGRLLGFQVVSSTKDGAGANVTSRVAPFARPFVDEAIPANLPSPDVLWGRSHHTSVRFELAQDTAPIKLIAVQPFQGAAGKDDLLELTFDKPMRGYPEPFISVETTRTSNYRFVLGRTVDAREKAAYEAADPAVMGNSPSIGVTFDEQDPRKVILRDSAGSFDKFRRFKLWVSPKVVDIHGASFADGKGATYEGPL